MAGGTMARGGSRRAPIVGINVTPLVDVVLVLLIIMMVSANFVVERALKVELPRSASRDQRDARKEPPLTVGVSKDGSLFLGDKPIDEAALGVALRAAAKKDPAQTINLAADEGATHGRVIRAMDLVKQAGLHKFAIRIRE